MQLEPPDGGPVQRRMVRRGFADRKAHLETSFRFMIKAG
jgi:hypothetical protein